MDANATRTIGSVRSIEPNGALRTGVIALVSGGLLGKLLGVVRELALASLYGTSALTAAFRIAQTSTLVPVNLVTGDALNSGFLPLQARQNKDLEQDSGVFYRSVFLFLVLATSLLALLLVIGSDLIVDVVAPGLSEETKATASQLTKIMSLGIPFFVAASLQSYFALSHGLHRLVSLRSTVQNVGILLGVLAAWATANFASLAWGFTAGCIFYYLIGEVYLRRAGIAPGYRIPSMKFAWTAMGPFLKVLRGLLILPFLLQALEIYERVVASTIGEQAVAATEYANFIVDTGLLLLAFPLGLAGLASLANSENMEKAAKERAEKLTPLVLLLSTPFTLMLTIKALPLTQLLYQRGSFDNESSRVTASILTGFGFGLTAQVLGYVYLKIYSGTLQVKSIVLISSAAIFLSAATLSAVFIIPDPMIVGLGGATYGYALLILCALRLRVMGTLLRWVVILLPGLISNVVLMLLLPAASAGDLLIVIALCLLCWVGAAFLVPTSRRFVLAAVRR